MNISLYLYNSKSLESRDRQSDYQDPTTFPSRSGKKYDLSAFLQTSEKTLFVYQLNQVLSVQATVYL